MGDVTEQSDVSAEQVLTFAELLRAAGLKKQELADRLGLRRPSVSRWGANPPRYARAYLELLVEYQGFREARGME